MKGNIGILGYGEIGEAIGKFYKQKIFVKDPKFNSREGGHAVFVKEFGELDILHVAIPYDDNFIECVKNEISKTVPKLIFIHSTVAPGTTKLISFKAVHAPIESSHPYIYEQMKVFYQFIGYDDIMIGIQANTYLTNLGLETRLVKGSINTELGKICSTTYYGLNIAWHGEIKRLCEQFGADFNVVSTDFTNNYNRGYKLLGQDYFIRQNLYPPEGGCGGHCCIENTNILKSFFKSSALDFIMEYKPKDKILNKISNFKSRFFKDMFRKKI